MRKFVITTIFLFLFLFLFGCSSNGVQFTDIVKSEGISKISSRHGGSGLLYSITDQDKINDFVNIMNSTTYSETKPFAVGGSSAIRFYDENGEEITSVNEVNDVFRIGDVYYKTNTDISDRLSMFYKEFYSDENIVVE